MLYQKVSTDLKFVEREKEVLKFWEDNVDKLISDNDFPLLDDKGSWSRIQADKKVEEIYLEFDQRRKDFEAKEADRQEAEELKLLEDAESKIKGRKNKD